MSTEKESTDFRYKDVLEKGRPQHAPTDHFRIRHPSMPCSKRAKIFAPFDALRGFNEMVKSKEIHYIQKRALSEYELEELDRKLAELQELTYNGTIRREHPLILTVTYFKLCEDPKNDAYHSAGTYETITGICHGISPDKTIRVDQTRIPIADIVSMKY